MLIVTCASLVENVIAYTDLSEGRAFVFFLDVQKHQEREKAAVSVHSCVKRMYSDARSFSPAE